MNAITYPSQIEGFGNAYLEAVYFRRPIVGRTYKVFKTDIQPKGFKFIAFDDFLSDVDVQRTREVLRSPGLVEEMVAHNFELGRLYFSYRALERRLHTLIEQISPSGCG